jgi:two-component system, OmpR family, alkaline phosphatase synthesis response regulator PhoP
MPKRILIVDDDQDLTRLFRLILRRLNAEIEIVSSGERALQSIRVCRPSLILLDLMLPDIDGSEVCRRLRAEPATQDLPVIIVSARPNAPEVAQAVGATDCLLKPFLPQELVQLVQSVLHNCAADDGAQDGHAALGPQSLTMPGTGLVQSGLGMGKATLSGVGLSS